MCTSLSYRDAKDRVYCGRTMELGAQLAYDIAYVPPGEARVSETGGGRPPLRFETRYGLIGVFHGPPAADGGSPALRDCTVVDGMNNAGLVFNVLAYPDAGGPQPARVVRDPALNVIDFGLWALGQFASVAEVRAALDRVPFLLEPLAGLGVQPPFHYSLYDRSGAALVVEFHKGELSLYDNPVGVMTNGPQFSWHLVNINNYAHLSNRDRSAGRLGRLELRQPDAGISMAGLPSDTTSVGRFVRAAYFASFAEKAADPDAAVRTVGHIMNNFDRVRGLSLLDPDVTDSFGETMGASGQENPTEFTTWTQLSDTERGLYFLRACEALNYTRFDLGALSHEDRALSVPLARLPALGGEGTPMLGAIEET